MAQREALRSSEQMRAVALRFWAALGKGMDDSLSRDEYTWAHLRIGRALAPELSAAEAQQAADEDWEDDACDPRSGRMGFDEWAVAHAALESP